MSASTVITYNLVGLVTDFAYTGSVIAANPTATTIVINDPYLIAGNSETITFGPWAQMTPPPDASTGVFDLFKDPADLAFSEHCEIASRTATLCTFNDDGYRIWTSTDMYPPLFAFNQIPITITAGVEQLQSVTPNNPAASTTTSGSTSHTGGSSRTSSAASAVAISTASSTNAAGGPSSSSSSVASLATTAHTGAASRAHAANVGTLGLFGLALAFFMRH